MSKKKEKEKKGGRKAIHVATAAEHGANQFYL